MKKTLFTLIIGAGLVTPVLAQIPTINVGSLRALYQQYQTMQQQLDTSKGILSQATQIYNQEVKTYETALGNINTLKAKAQAWLNSFTRLGSTNFFAAGRRPFKVSTATSITGPTGLAYGQRDLTFHGTALGDRLDQGQQRHGDRLGTAHGARGLQFEDHQQCECLAQLRQQCSGPIPVRPR